MCGRYVVTNPVAKTAKIVKKAINVDNTENYNAHPQQDLPVLKKYINGNTLELLTVSYTHLTLPTSSRV